MGRAAPAAHDPSARPARRRRRGPGAAGRAQGAGRPDAKTNKIWEDPNGYLGQGISTDFEIDERMRFRTSDMAIGVRLSIPASRNRHRRRAEPGAGMGLGGRLRHHVDHPAVDAPIRAALTARPDGGADRSERR